MRRWGLIGLVGSATAWPAGARAQQSEPARRVGLLIKYTRAMARAGFASLGVDILALIRVEPTYGLTA